MLEERGCCVLSAELKDNAGSEETCSMVVRSLYLEVRDICVDKGSLPPVDFNKEDGVVTLKLYPRPKAL